MAEEILTNESPELREVGKPIIEVVNLTKKFGDLLVLDDISESVRVGEKVVVIGPSGGGKSTFLRCLNCLEDPTSGQIFFEGVDLADLKVDINEHRRKMGMVFQQFNLFNNLTVKKNITEEHHPRARQDRHCGPQESQAMERLHAPLQQAV